MVGGKTTTACNGSPWKPGTLPSGKTLTGHWAGSGFGEAAFPEPGTGQAWASVSFTVPLEVEPKESHYIEEGQVTPAGCTGNAETPGAEPGNLLRGA